VMKTRTNIVIIRDMTRPKAIYVEIQVDVLLPPRKETPFITHSFMSSSDLKTRTRSDYVYFLSYGTRWLALTHSL